MHPKTKPAYHHDRLREALIAEVLRALEAHEADRLSMRELAGRVGVSHTAAYAHFSDKAALWTAVADVGFERLHADLARAVDAASTAGDRLAAAGLAYLAFARVNPELYRLMFGPGRRAHEPSGPARAAFEVLLAAVAGLPSAGGARRAANRVRTDALTAWSLVHGLASLEDGGNLGMLDGRDTSALERHAVAVLVAGLSAA
ncbi:MAG: TetR/AcrR family transcriptional regulator [Candidatus Velthaea sp.]|jgi:AcrR family transcriptional regulator